MHLFLVMCDNMTNKETFFHCTIMLPKSTTERLAEMMARHKAMKHELEEVQLSGDDQFSLTEPPQGAKTNTNLERGTRASTGLCSLESLLTLLGPCVTSVTHHMSVT